MVPDFQTKPIFELHVWCGDDRGKPRYEFYDVMHVEDDEWERYASIKIPLWENCSLTSQLPAG